MVYLPRTPEVSSTKIKQDLYDANAVEKTETLLSHDDIDTDPKQIERIKFPMEKEVSLIVDSSNKIYGKFGDRLSKYIFENRLLWSFTGNTDFIQNVICTTDEGKTFRDELSSSKQNYIFGAGTWGTHIARAWKGHFDGFLDNNSQKWGGTDATGLKIYSPKDLLKDGFSGNIWIGTRLYYKEIKDQLIHDFGISTDQIKNAGKIIDEMAVRQYFDLDELPRYEKEVFLDVGSLDGMTALRFLNWAGDSDKRVYCFEPDEKNVEKVLKNLNKEIELGYAKIIPYGAWDQKTTLKFKATGNGVSMVSDDGVSINASTIDEEIPGEESVSFIKMDIEGSELRALIGAENTIKRNHPKLAISAYHKPEDIITLANEILQIDDSYRFYLRHYSLTDEETVLYGL